jgi:cytochrome c-type biogenesis protein CcmE
MAEATWEKSPETVKIAKRSYLRSGRARYLFIGLVLLGVVAYLLYTGMGTGRYYMTVEEMLSDPDNVGKNIRVAGAVDGDTIRFDPATQTLTFVVANSPNDNDAIREQGGLAKVLHNAVENPDARRVTVVWENAEVPDLLQHEAQAIMTGKLDENGVFHAKEVLLKCPTRYSDDVPEQVTSK